MIWVPFWWRWRQPKLRFGCCWQPSHLYVHFASQNMDYAVSITEKNRPKSKNDSDLLWWRWRQPKLRFGCCCATFAFICPFCFAKYGLCGFDYRKKTDPNRKTIQICYGGAGVIKDEHPSVSVFSPSKAASISSSGILSMLKGFLLALIIKVK